MEAGGLTGEVVAEHLTALGQTYDSFDIHQTTLSLPRYAYEQARTDAGGGVASSAAVEVHNEQGEVLLVREGGGWRLPEARIDPGDLLEEGARRCVREATGVGCEITDLLRISLVSFYDERDSERPPVYRFAALFDARHTSGTPRDGVRWRVDSPALNGTFERAAITGPP